jgi:pyruvate-formate lyase
MTATVTAGVHLDGAWRGFAGSRWRERVDVRDSIQANYTPYEGDASFLTGATDRTREVWGKVGALFPEERRRGVLDVDTATAADREAVQDARTEAGRAQGQELLVDVESGALTVERAR